MKERKKCSELCTPIRETAERRVTAAIKSDSGFSVLATRVPLLSIDSDTAANVQLHTTLLSPLLSNVYHCVVQLAQAMKRPAGRRRP
jgi:hypothetical protein